MLNALANVGFLGAKRTTLTNRRLPISIYEYTAPLAVPLKSAPPAPSSPPGSLLAGTSLALHLSVIEGADAAAAKAIEGVLK